MSRGFNVSIVVMMFVYGAATSLFSGCDSKLAPIANNGPETNSLVHDSVARTPETEDLIRRQDVPEESPARQSDEADPEQQRSVHQPIDICCVETRFVYLRWPKEAKRTFEDDILEAGFSGRERRPYCLFVRCESGPTDRLCLAICNLGEYLVLKRVELCQFDKVVFRGNLNIKMSGRTLQFVEIPLRRKIYTDIKSLVEGLKRGESDAIAFHNEYALPQLKRLETDTWGGFGMLDKELDRCDRRFLFLKECQIASK